jgi:hypothetical protein
LLVQTLSELKLSWEGEYMSDRDKVREADEILASAGYRWDGRPKSDKTSEAAASDVMRVAIRCPFSGRSKGK